MDDVGTDDADHGAHGTLPGAAEGVLNVRLEDEYDSEDDPAAGMAPVGGDGDSCGDSREDGQDDGIGPHAWPDLRLRWRLGHLAADERSDCRAPQRGGEARGPQQERLDGHVCGGGRWNADDEPHRDGNQDEVLRVPPSTCEADKECGGGHDESGQEGIARDSCGEGAADRDPSGRKECRAHVGEKGGEEARHHREDERSRDGRLTEGVGDDGRHRHGDGHPHQGHPDACRLLHHVPPRRTLDREPQQRLQTRGYPGGAADEPTG